jgi:hypothetical protein
MITPEVTELVMAARMVMADIEDYLDGAWDGDRDGWLACVDALGDALAAFTESQED